jgi:hypothetical protein
MGLTGRVLRALRLRAVLNGDKTIQNTERGLGPVNILRGQIRLVGFVDGMSYWGGRVGYCRVDP